MALLHLEPLPSRTTRGDVLRFLCEQGGLDRGQVGRIDLHGRTQSEAHAALLSFLHRAQAAGARFVLVITGKGLAGGGILREQVPRWLNQPPNRGRVLAFDYAQAQHGGMGALYVLLKRQLDA